MSNERKLLVYRDSKLLKEFSLHGEFLTIGREDHCDIVLDAESVSRLHAKIILQEDSVYIENQSSTGQLFVDSQQIEVAEWNKDQDAKIGPFVLKWTNGEAQRSVHQENAEPPALKESENQPNKAQDPENASSSFAFQNDWASADPDPNAEALSLIKPSDSELESNGNGANFVVTNDSDDVQPDVNFGSNDHQPELEIEDVKISEADANQSTKIADNDAVGFLKITLGETIGREIPLDQGFQWIVGRSAKCHIKIDNGKLSRQHFKIVKASGRYRLQDLGSSNGTRLNGVAVSDAPLSPFDTIVAGPVEFQFLVAQAQSQSVPAISEQPFSSQESTQFAPPPMVYSGEAGGNPFEHASQSSSKTNSHTNPYAQAQERTSSGSKIHLEAPKSLGAKGRIWWNETPKNKKLLYTSVLAMLFAILLIPSEQVPQGSEDSTSSTETNTPSTGSTDDKASSESESTEARANDISPEFYLLSAEDRRKIQDAYARAQRARNASDWKEAVAQAKEVTKYVDKYKDISDILAESQTHFNEVILGAVTKNLKNSLDAEAQVQEQVTLFVEAGKKAISESRWTDAQDQCAKAVSLDPKDEEANKCYAAAYGQDANYVASKTPDSVLLPTDPNLEIQAQLERDLEGKRQIYQAAQALEQSANLDKALESYKFLLSQVDKEIDGINMPGRYPASVSLSYAEKNTELKMQVEQRVKDIYLQYESDFRTQLVDAEQLIANQDYVRARETYDRVLNAAPNFQDVRSKRAELYRRMISEARGIYHEALIYESVGDLQSAIDKYTQAKRLLAGIVHPSADEYYRKANSKLRTLVP